MQKLYEIYVEIEDGMLRSISGDQIPTDCQIHFIVRDMDNINSGDPDPQPEGYVPEVHYW